MTHKVCGPPLAVLLAVADAYCDVLVALIGYLVRSTSHEPRPVSAADSHPP
jgi:hypothetical protein